MTPAALLIQNVRLLSEEAFKRDFGHSTLENKYRETDTYRLSRPHVLLLVFNMLPI